MAELPPPIIKESPEPITALNVVSGLVQSVVSAVAPKPVTVSPKLATAPKPVTVSPKPATVSPKPVTVAPIATVAPKTKKVIKIVNDEEESKSAELARKEIERQESKEVEEESIPTIKTKRSRKKAIHVVNDTADPIEKMKLFFKKRAKDHVHYTYTPEGDLRVEGIGADETIPLRFFSELTMAEHEELEEARLTVLSDADTGYEIALEKLREVTDSYKQGNASIQSVVRANKEVHDANLIRIELAYPLKWIKDVEGLEIKKVILDKAKEQRKMGFDVYLYKHSTLSKNDIHGHYRDGPLEKQQGGEQQELLFITDLDNKETGNFHPAFVKEFVFNETRYSSPYQGFEGERFRELGNEQMRKQILGTRSASTIHTLAELEPEQVKNPKELWTKILQAYYEQNKDQANLLKETGSRKFHMMDKKFSHDYVEALETARSKIRESEDVEVKPQVIKESVITEDEQKKAKVGAIINRFRH